MKFLTRFVLNKKDIDSLKAVGFPFAAVVLTYIVCISALLQGVSDFTLKALYYGGFTPTLSLSLEFAFLTLISMLMSVQAVSSMKKRRLEITKNSLEMSFLTEAALFLSDFTYVVLNFDNSFAVLIRFPFILFTFINVIIVSYLCLHLKIDIFSVSRMSKEIIADFRYLMGIVKGLKRKDSNVKELDYEMD